MRIANPFIMITHVIASLREADAGQQSAGTIELKILCARRQGPPYLDEPTSAA
jgi:hypothetical protein